MAQEGVKISATFETKFVDENFQKGSPNLVTLPPIVPMLFFYFFAAHKSWQKFESRFWTIDESAVCKASDKLVTVQICFLKFQRTWAKTGLFLLIFVLFTSQI